jgi:FG-GAP-like repeat
VPRILRRLSILLIAAGVAPSALATLTLPQAALQFELVQPDLFGAPGGQPNTWADFDGDDDLDLFVGFRGRPNRLYRNTNGRFEDVAAAVGVADATETRAAAWGDYDADGDPDLYVGFASGESAAKIYRNDRPSSRFIDVAAELGVDLRGVSRQPAWVDYDGDGDLDLFAAFRDRSNQLFRNDGRRFIDVTAATGIGDARRTVGAVWWDFDADGDLDLFVANQEGDANGLFRNDSGRFVDVATAAGVAGVPRPSDQGGVGPSLADVDLDGDFDLFVANYGPSALYRNDGKGMFADIARDAGITFAGHATTSAFGDVDGNGWPDLYLGAFLATEPHYRDGLYLNQGRPSGVRFVEALPSLFLHYDASHGVQFIDFDGDGRLDLWLTNNDATGSHPLLRNVSAISRRSLSVTVTSAKSRSAVPGAEVRVFAAGTRRLIAAGVVDSGSGYCSQSAGSVFLGVRSDVSRVDVEVTIVANGRRRLTVQKGIAVTGPTPLLMREP